MISLLARITRGIIRLYTYPFRKNHLSLSRSIKFKQKSYKPPKHYHYEIIKINGTKVEVLSPMNESIACIILFHGGGHTQGMNNMYRKAMEKLCKMTKCPVYSIDYETGSDLVYPSLHDESYLAYIGLYNKLKNKKIIAIGDSFGANLMLSTCLRLRDNHFPLPNALISISCFIDLAATGISYKTNCYNDPLYSLPKNQKFEDNEEFIRRKTPYCGKTSPFDKFLSPAYNEYSNFPEMLIQCGEVETSLSDNYTLYQKALLSNINVTLSIYRGMWHDFLFLTPFLKESKQAFKEIADFINKVIK